MANWYVSSVAYAAVTAWAATTAYSVGDIRRQTNATPAAPRVFRCTTAGTSGGTEPTWVTTKGATTNDGTAVWTEITGQAIYNGDGGGSLLAAPFQRISDACTATWAAAGDTVYVASNHAPSMAASQTWAGGTTAVQIRVICADLSTVPPTDLATTAVETITATTASFTLTNSLYVYGLTLTTASTSSNNGINLATTAATNPQNIVLEECFLNARSTNASSRISFGSGSGANARDAGFYVKNCTLSLGGANARFAFGNGRIVIEDCVFASNSTAPTVLGLLSTGAGPITLRDCDISLITGTLFDISSAAPHDVYVQNCQLGSGVTPTTGTVTSAAGNRVYIHNSDSTGTNYRLYETRYEGTVQHELSIVRTGGASDGTTPISWHATTTANSTFFEPLQLPEIAMWNDTTGSAITAAIYITHSASALLTNEDIWIEVEYLGASGNPLGSIVTTRNTNFLGSATDYATDSSTWGGSAQTYKQKITTASFTPQLKGPIKVRVYLAVASTTVYIDPKIG